MILPTEYRMSQQAIMYIPEDLTFPKEQRFSEAMAEKAIELLSITEGRAFLLFTSIAQMKAVYDRLVNRIPYPLLLQGKKPAELLLREFRRTPHAVLLGVQSFWQGVDIQGEALSCVIVEKIPFSVPTDPLVSARLERIREQGGNPFMEYQIPEAILHLKQGLGRLIRSRTDRGILALFDRRILTRPYGRLFRESLPDCPLTHDLEEVRRFFQSPADRPGEITEYPGSGQASDAPG
jgi:ATP-dependent DNA helicase DinG